MSAPPELRVGVIGYGVMGKAHCYAYRVAPMLRRLPVTPVVSVISGRDGAAVAAAAAAYGVPGGVQMSTMAMSSRPMMARQSVVCPGTP